MDYGPFGLAPDPSPSLLPQAPLSLPPLNDSCALSIALNLFELKSYEGALSTCEAFSQSQGPHRLDLLLLQATCLLLLDRPGDSLSVSYQTISEFPDCAEAAANAAFALESLGQASEAILLYERAIQVGSIPLAGCASRVAVLYERRGDLGQALRYYHHYLEVSLQTYSLAEPRLLVHAARLLLAQGKGSFSELGIGHAGAGDPSSPDPTLSALCSTTAMLRKAVQMDSSHAVAWRTLGDSLRLHPVTMLTRGQELAPSPASPLLSPLEPWSATGGGRGSHAGSGLDDRGSPSPAGPIGSSNIPSGRLPAAQAPAQDSALTGLASCRREAIQCYRRALQLSPDDHDAQHALGLMLHDAGEYLEAEAHLRMALHGAQRAERALQLAQSQATRREVAGASSSPQGTGEQEGAGMGPGRLPFPGPLGPALSLRFYSQVPEILNNLGNTLMALSDPTGVTCFQESVEKYIVRFKEAGIIPNHVEALGGVGYASNQGLAADLNDPHVRTALRCLAIPLNNLAGAIKGQGDIIGAIYKYAQCVALFPEQPEPLVNFASCCKDLGRHHEAIQYFTKVLELRPDSFSAFANRLHSQQCICEWTGRASDLLRLEANLRAELAAGAVPSVQPFHALSYPFSPQLSLALSRAYAAVSDRAARSCVAKRPQIRDEIQALRSPKAPLQRGKRLRIGFVSADFGMHPLSQLMGRAFSLFDRSSIEVFCYALNAPDGSALRTLVEQGSEHFVSLHSIPNAADAARRIVLDRPHVLVNLTGYTRGCRNEIFAFEPAPVQVQFLGFPGTMGDPHVPWIVSDSVVTPYEPDPRRGYSERVARMPPGLSYFPCGYRWDYASAVFPSGREGEAEREGMRRQLGFEARDDDMVVFFSPNQLYKICPTAFACWMRILARVPRSVLWLLRFPAEGEANLRREAQARGVDPSRLVFTDVSRKEEHIRRCGAATLALDTMDCNAHTGACDLLFAGVPIVTLLGERLASRVCGSLAVAAGVPELVTESLEQYEDLAVRLALDHGWRREMRSRLEAGREACSLFDLPRWVRGFAEVVRGIWEAEARAQEAQEARGVGEGRTA